MRIFDLAFQGIDPSDIQQLRKSSSWEKALVVREHAQASEIADLVDLNKMDLVVVINGGNDIIGGFAPNTVMRRAQERLMLNSGLDSFAGVVAEIEKLTTPLRQGFEWLNHSRPDWYWCERGHHLTSKKPCPEKH